MSATSAFYIALWFALSLLVSGKPCSSPLVRQEWRTLSSTQKHSYINAVKCVMQKPALSSKTIVPGTTNRFEDFLGDHIYQTNHSHFVGSFYAYHRLLIWEYEKEVRACGFNGGHPYWDWSLDANSTEALLASPIFDAETGFGGNGPYIPSTSDADKLVPLTNGTVPASIADRSGGGCVADGPFANMTIHMGPGPSTESTTWCLRRDFVPSLFQSTADPALVAASMEYPDFGTFTKNTELTVHNAGHTSIGGLSGALTDAWASPADPLFFLHHTNMDRLWWSWQSRNLSARLQDISGPRVAHDWSNAVDRNVTLTDSVYVGSGVWNMTRTIADLMDIRGHALGYTYAGLY